MKIFIKIISIIIIISCFSGCSTIFSDVLGFKHTAALVIGERREEILPQVNHVLGHPKFVQYAFKETSDEVEVIVYPFTVEKDLCLLFYRTIFVQAALVEPDSKTGPMIREDYKEVRKGYSSPFGYMLNRGMKVASIKAIDINGKEY